MYTYVCVYVCDCVCVYSKCMTCMCMDMYVDMDKDMHVYRYAWKRHASVGKEVRALSGGTNVRLPCATIHVCACRARRENSQYLAKSSPYEGHSAGTEVAGLRKWHVWCLLGDETKRRETG